MSRVLMRTLAVALSATAIALSVPAVSAATPRSLPANVPARTAPAATSVPTSYWTWLCYTNARSLPVLRNTYSSRSGARLAQWALRRAGYSPGPVDGIYGPVTRRAVRAFQYDYGLYIDGVTGPQTWGQLQYVLC